MDLRPHVNGVASCLDSAFDASVFSCHRAASRSLPASPAATSQQAAHGVHWEERSKACSTRRSFSVPPVPNQLQPQKKAPPREHDDSPDRNHYRKDRGYKLTVGGRVPLKTCMSWQLSRVPQSAVLLVA